MGLAQDQNLKDFFNILAQKQCEQAKARLIDALTRIEEVMQEAEVMSSFCIGFEDISVNFMPHCLFANSQRARLIKRLELLKNAKVVAMTITKASIDHKLLHHLQPEMIVIEEAGGILESNVIACLTPNTKHLVMVGDYKQIGPMVRIWEVSVE